MIQDILTELGLLLRSGWQLVALETFEEERALRVLQRVSKTAERELIIWSVASGIRGNGKGAGSLDEGLRTLSGYSKPAVLAVLDAQALLGETVAIRRLRDLLPVFAERKQTVVLLGPALDLPVELTRESARIELPLPKANELKSLFQKMVEGQNPAVLEAAVRAALGLTGSEAVRVFRKACMVANGLNQKAVSWIVSEKRQALRRTNALSFHESPGGLGDVGGLDELKRWLRERRRAFDDEARSFDLPIPRGLLLLGVQGCGKSLAAKAVAREWQFPLLRLDLAAAFGSSDKSPEVTIREASAIAESIAPAVLWIDEIEKGFAASAADPRASRVFGWFLTWLSEKTSPVFVVATANDVQALPPELLRRGRFDELFFVDLPTQAERVEILAIHLGKRSRDPLRYSLEELAEQSERLSGAELEQAVGAALYTAFAEERDLTENDLTNAITETVPLYDTYEERIKELRDWARTRARSATYDVKMIDLFHKD